MVTYVYVKHRKSMQNGPAVYFNIHTQFLTLTMWPSRLQKQKESYRTHVMMERRKNGLGSNMMLSTRNSTQLCRALLIVITVVLMIAANSTAISKWSIVLSWRKQSMLSQPNQWSMARISSLGHMVPMMSYNMHSVSIAKTESAGKD